ncbi:MAG: amino acid permease [Pseudomonadota bacterium]
MSEASKSFYTPATAIAVVMANMIGTGVFTSLGFQLADIRSPFVLLLLWVVGGVTALCGALCYAELGSALPRSGGEYHFLGRVLHPSLGFVAGWVSATIGFAAPSALAAMTFAAYLDSVFPGLNRTVAACVLVVALIALHASSRRSSGATQRWFTWLKIALIVGFCALALWLVPAVQPVSFAPAAGDGALLTGGAFAVSLIYVSYAYTGWNAATYLSGELAAPQKSLAPVLVIGTAVVLLLYLLLNATFLLTAPMAAMAGQVEVGFISAQHAFGGVGASIMGLLLSALLISTVSAMTLAGPRVLQVVGEDYPLFAALGRTNASGVPRNAVMVQGLLTLAFIVSASFEAILLFAGFTLAVNTAAVVVALFVLRRTEPDLERPFRVPLYPLPALIYLGITLWTAFYVVRENPAEAGWGVAIFALGGVAYVIARRIGSKPVD